MTDRKEVINFLNQIRETICNPIKGCDGWTLVPRKENKACITALGFNLSDIATTILSLITEDYCKGPDTDRGQKGKVWIFGKSINGKEVYIKIKLASLSRLKMVRVISFHFSHQTMVYPFKIRSTKEVYENDKSNQS